MPQDTTLSPCLEIFPPFSYLKNFLKLSVHECKAMRIAKVGAVLNQELHACKSENYTFM